jgi:hypothetical protein
MTNEPRGLPPAALGGPLPGALRPRSQAVRLGIGSVAIALASMLLAACAGTDGGLFLDGSSSSTTLKRPARMSAARAGTAKAGPAAESKQPAGSAMTTGSIGKAVAAVDLPYRPAVGSRWIGTSELRETKAKGGRVVEAMVRRDRGEYRVVEKLEKGYRISYTLLDGNIDGNTPLTELMRPLIRAMKGQSYTYETDADGTPARVLDVDRLKALAVKAVDTMAQSKPEFGTVPQLKQFVDGVRAQFDAATPETGVDLFLEPVVRLSMVQGLTNVPLGEERSYDDVVVNPLTGSKMRAKGSFRIAAIDKAKGLATVEWRLEGLPEDLDEATRDLAKRLAPDGAGAEKLDEAVAQMKMEHLDKAAYKIALVDGVVRRMDRIAIVKAQGIEKKTVVTVTLSPVR